MQLTRIEAVSLSRTRRRLIALAAVVALSGVIVAADPTPSSANTSCHALSLTINSNPRAEAPSTAMGHGHVTGNHYNSSRTNGTWVWRADNNGGSDGDTADTAYGTRRC
ncbi:hypothetical protein Cde04nite_31730 [Cellulomonas denverensis]|nr:hypothetical protein Cde04nite_31730 [Cellulomonas denverensis]